jgi:DNA repair protein RadC
VAALLVPFAGAGAQDLAERLIARFGGLSHALAAPLAELQAVAGDQTDAVAAIDGARRLMTAVLYDDLAEARVDPGNASLVRFLRAQLATATDEQLYAVFADPAGRFIGHEAVAGGGARRIELRARQLISAALARGAAGFLLAHNHPSGNCTPSAQDLIATRRLDAIAGELDLTLIDHLVITRREVFSMRRGRRL